MSELQQAMQAFQPTSGLWSRFQESRSKTQRGRKNLALGLPDQMSVVKKARPILGGEDQRIVRRALIGDSDALSTLLTRDGGRLYRAAYSVLRNKEDAEDALQDGLLSAYINLRSFEGRSQFATWLTRVVINAALMNRRRLCACPALPLDEFAVNDVAPRASIGTGPRPDPEELFARSETRNTLVDAINQLPTPLRSAFRLRHIQGLSTREAARAEGVKVSVIKSRLLRARRRLVSLLEARGVTLASSCFSSRVQPSRIRQHRLHFNPKGAI